MGTLNQLDHNPNIFQRVSQGLLVLVIRQIIAYGSIFLGNILLSRWLPTGTYGLFAAALAFHSTLIVFSDVGLGAALIQRAEEPTEDEIASLFTLQLIIFGALTMVVWVFAPSLTRLMGLNPEYVTLIRALAITIVIIAFRSIPAILLERNLRFDAIALAETIGMVSYQIVLVTLVWFKFGVMSIIWGLAIRYLLDLTIIYNYNPWRPRLSFKLGMVIPYICFGLNIQGVRVMAYVKDQLAILLLVPILGASSAGIWSWALTYIGIPVYFIRLIDRVIFPAFSRIQDDRRALGDLATTIYWLSFAVGLPALLILTLFSKNMISLIYGKTWLVAIPVIILLIPNMVGGLITGPGFPILYAVGKSNLALRLFTVWAVLTLTLGITGIYFAQLNGLATGYSIATMITSGILLNLVRSDADFNLRKAIVAPFAATAVASLFVWITFSFTDLSWWFVAIISLGLYGVILLVLSQDHLRSLLHREPGTVWSQPR